MLAAATLGGIAHARAADVAGGGDEEAALRRGFELREKGSDEAALAEFQRAYDLKKGARARAQMALAEQALGRWIDAEAHLAEALQRTGDPWIARNRTLLDQALGEIRQHIGSLELSGGTPGAEVRVNGRVAGKMPLDRPLRVEAGSVSLEVRAAGYLPVIRTINVPANGLAREPIALVAVSGAAGRPRRARDGAAGADQRRSGRRRRDRTSRRRASEEQARNFADQAPAGHRARHRRNRRAGGRRRVPPAAPEPGQRLQPRLHDQRNDRRDQRRAPA